MGEPPRPKYTPPPREAFVMVIACVALFSLALFGSVAVWSYNVTAAEEQRVCHTHAETRFDHMVCEGYRMEASGDDAPQKMRELREAIDGE